MNLKEIFNFEKRGSGESRLSDFWYFFRRVRPNRTIVILGVLIAAAVAGIVFVFNHVDQNYDVLSTIENEDTQSSEYIQMGDDLLKYGNESVSLLSQSGDTLWNQTYDMSDPSVSILGGTAVIYDRRGTSR